MIEQLIKGSNISCRNWSYREDTAVSDSFIMAKQLAILNLYPMQA
jgi:hypothetical protein